MEELGARLAEILTRVWAVPVSISDLVQLTGGAAKRTFVFTSTCGQTKERLILQLASAPTAIVSKLTPRLHAEEDAHLMQRAGESGVLAPRVVAILEPGDGLGGGFVTRFVEAEVMGRRIVHNAEFGQARARLTRQCAENLAAIHRLPVRDFAYLRSYEAAEQISAYETLVRHYGVRSPELAYGFAWARSQIPSRSASAVVHGDFRMGNLMVDSNGLACVLDWEVAHLGDPLQDLGWLCVRTWRFGGAQPVAGVGSRGELFDAYERAGGAPVDAAAVRFWEAWGNLKWAVMALRKGLKHLDGGKPSLEDCAVGRRMEEPLWDFLDLLDAGAA